MDQKLKKRIDKFDNPEAVRFFFELLRTLIRKANIDESDGRLSINVRNDYRKRISVSINSRLVLFIQRDVQFGLLLNEAFLDQVQHIPILKKETFARQQPAASLLYFDFDVVRGHIETIMPLWLQSCLEYLPAQEKSQYRHHHISELYEIANNQEMLEEYLRYAGTFNVKRAFIHWMIRTDGTDRNYFSSQFGSDEYRFSKEIDEYEDVYRQQFNAELFLVFPENVQGKLEELQANLYSKQNEFSEYNRKKASGRPTAILGTQNYFKFLKEFFHSKQPMEKSSLREKLLPYIERYKKLISEPGSYSEIYKWESLQNFKNHWDLAAVDLPQMIENALPGSNNLWSSNNYYPVAMLKGFAETNPQGVSNAITALYDESEPLEKRIQEYREAMDTLLREDSIKRNQENKSNYQDGRTIALLLAFQYPDKHFLFKFNILKAFCNKFGYEAPKKGDVVNQVLTNESLNKEVKEILEDDDDLLKLHEMRLTPNSYRDDNNNLLAQDFIYATVTYLNDDAKYYLVGSFWDTSTPQDQTLRFVEEGTWVNGYTDRFNDDVRKVKPGSRIAIKSAFVREKTKSVMAIKARGVVIENLNDGQTLQVDWEQNFVPFEVSFGGYLTTIKEVTNRSHIEAIWGEKELVNDDLQSTKHLKKAPLNQILYGPPGTGKTYETKNLAVNIADPTFIVPKEFGDTEKRKRITARYQELVDNGQIVFCTFHQSMSYEDFVEGIKPETIGDNISYSVQPGVFKDLCEKAGVKSNSNFEDVIERFKTDVIANEPIKINTGRSKFDVFYRGGLTFKVNPEESEKENPNYSASIENMRKFYQTNSLKGIYNPSYVSGIVNHLYEKYGLVQYNTVSDSPNKDYVLIIDEINRGNVSAIFGELITLLEADKRIGQREEVLAKLPYSKDSFGVPANVHIIGTMNTADRSVEALDTALRRRFSFKEIMSEPRLLQEIGFDGFTLDEVLVAINQRIEVLLDRDHTIGHSYFIKIKNGDTEALRNAFKNCIVPLLQEYFYGDYEKIALVLGKGFVRKKQAAQFSFASFDDVEIPETGAQFELIQDVDNIEEAVGLLLNRNGQS